MKNRFPLIALLASCAFVLTTCNKSSVAYLDASVTAVGDNTGESSTRARINFTDFNQPPGPSGNDSKLRANFSNPEGDNMLITLSPIGADFPIGSYPFDGSTNSFEASFTVTFASGPQTVEITTTEGFINLNGITIEAGVITTMQGEFQLNIDGGGTAAGTINYSR